MAHQVHAFQEIKRLPTVNVGSDTHGFDEVKKFLMRFGYSHTTLEQNNILDQATSEALRNFQRFFRLPVTGDFDDATQEVMTIPRCAHPDHPVDGRVSFETLCTWDRRALSYSFAAGSANVPGDAELDAVRAAFRTWAAVTGFAFNEGSADDPVDVQVAWRPADDPDYNMVGGVLAHADFPPACGVVTGRDLPKPVHFDDTEHKWVIGADSSGFDVETVALHEIGHILGLDHSEVPSAVMRPSFPAGFVLRQLAEDDLNGIRVLYGVGNSKAWGDPVAYFTPGDSTARVLYRGHDDHFHELSLRPGTSWNHADLTTATGAPPGDHDAAGFFNATPSAYYTASDDVARVVYRGDDLHIHEIWLCSHRGWDHADLSVAAGAPEAAGDPYGYYTGADRTARVIYRGFDDHVHELWLAPGRAWTHADLTPGAS